MEDVSDKPIRVLLVEDNPGDARLLEETLKQAAAEFHLEYAEQLSEAVEALAQEQFDVVCWTSCSRTVRDSRHCSA